MSVASYFDSLDYGPAPEADGNVRDWLGGHNAAFGHYSLHFFIAVIMAQDVATRDHHTSKNVS